jgi:hypothetical protein
MIRFATHDDMDEIFAISRAFYDEIQLDDVGYRFDDEQIRASYQRGIDRDEHYILLYIEDCRILGLFFFSIRSETYYFRDRKFASEIVWHSLPSLPPQKRLKVMMRLLDAGLMFIDMSGAESTYCGLDARKEFHHPGINRALQKRGFAHIINMHHRRKP